MANLKGVFTLDPRTFAGAPSGAFAADHKASVVVAEFADWDALDWGSVVRTLLHATAPFIDQIRTIVLYEPEVVSKEDANARTYIAAAVRLLMDCRGVRGLVIHEPFVEAAADTLGVRGEWGGKAASCAGCLEDLRRACIANRVPFGEVVRKRDYRRAKRWQRYAWLWSAASAGELDWKAIAERLSPHRGPMFLRGVK